eukprot:7313827-Alexandrium_andersonii.AAC.1
MSLRRPLFAKAWQCFPPPCRGHAGCGHQAVCKGVPGRLPLLPAASIIAVGGPCVSHWGQVVSGAVQDWICDMLTARSQHSLFTATSSVQAA